MKGKITLGIVLTALGLLLGCQCDQPNGNTGPTTTNTVPRSADAIQIVFTNAPPTNVVAALRGVGAQPDAANLVWLIPHWDFRNQQQEAAMEAALRAGATMRKPQ